MQIGLIGLGKMGEGLCRRLTAGGHSVVAFDPDRAAKAKVADLEVTVCDSLDALVAALPPPRLLWIMVPAGKATETTVTALTGSLVSGDMLIDGGNSNYKEAMRRSDDLATQGVAFLDVGTSGGVFGAKNGYCLMVGGDAAAVKQATPIFKTLAPGPDKGWAHVGPSGAGHFVKMIHNGIEYGMMQAMAEGFAILKSKSELDLDLKEIAEVWRHGSVVRSWLLDLAASALRENPTLEGVAPYVSDSGEGRWTVYEAVDRNVSAPVITLSLMERFRSRERDAFSDKLLSALRNQFGGHEMKSR